MASSAKEQQAQSAGSESSALVPSAFRPSFFARLAALGRAVGPGIITGASDDDRSGIATYAVAGASLGYLTLWSALLTYPLMASIQLICARIGLVTGRGLAGVLRKHYSKKLLLPTLLALVVANTINAGVDIGAIAASLSMLLPVAFAVWIAPIALVILALQIWGSYRLIANIFRWLTLALFAYIGSAFFAHPNWPAVARGTFIPVIRWDGAYLATLVALLGTTISPYLFFWQASQEVEEEKLLGRKRLSGRRGATNTELRYAAWDVNVGMLFSNVVMYFIILSTAATLFEAGRTNIETAQDAAEALRPLVGDAAYVLFTLGVIGSGFLAVPVLTGTNAYAMCEAFHWKHGLDERMRHAGRFYAVIILSTLAGASINFLGINPVRALFWTAVLNGLIAPPLLVLILLIANNRAVMGSRVNGPILNWLGGLAALLMFAAAFGLLWTWAAA